ncbi:MAG TPA: T9SS type A sorting domain-containing protein, partial [Chitinophagales bacterium]|nr:T9SS type A sorting domain-containing protein [Chitinophagales bacterium]
TEFKFSTLYQLMKVNNDLYFINDDETSSQEMWRSDGTACHTQKLDFVPGFSDETNILLVDGSILFLGLLTPEYGIEPWKYQATPISAIEICNGFDDDCDGLVDDNPIASINPSGDITACKGEAIVLASDAGINLTYQWLKNGSIINGATDYTYSTKKGGNYKVNVSSSSGCESSSDVVSINRIDKPDATILPLGNLDICVAGSVDLKANDGAGYQYQWLKKNKVLNGATNQIYTATKTGDYKVEVTNSDGCSELSQKTTVVSSCKQLAESSLQNSSFELYPNPVHEILIVKSEIGLNGTLVISNLPGAIVYIEKITVPEMKVDVSSFINGVYLIELRSGAGSITKKFVKE